MPESIINVSYIVAAILFILGIKMLGSATTAVKGNRISSLGMLIAIIVTLSKSGLDYGWIVAGLAVGGAIGLIAAKRVQMTGMPELVALFNGFGGLASLLVGWSEYEKVRSGGWDTYLEGAGDAMPGQWFLALVIVIAVIIGGITFTGSIVAYLKLSGKIGGTATTFPLQKLINLLVMIGAVVAGCYFIMIVDSETARFWLWWIIALALLIGALGVIPIGGGDMPVVIALLNSFSGLGAAAAGFVITNTVLVVAGCLVGASGLILSIIMCKAMNRSLGNVLFGGFGALSSSGGKQVDGEMKALTVEDA